MHLIIFGIVILLALVSDTYIWLSFLRASAPVWQVLHFVPTVGIVCLLVYMLTREATPKLFHAMFFLLLCFMLPKLLFTILSLTGRVIGLFWPPAFSALNITGLCLAAVIALSAFIGLAWGWKHIVVKPQSITCDGLPREFNGFKIVQLSDLHLETFENDPEIIEKLFGLPTNTPRPHCLHRRHGNQTKQRAPAFYRNTLKAQGALRCTLYPRQPRLCHLWTVTQ